MQRHNKRNAVIGLDFGTLSCRGVVINEEGVITHKKVVVYRNGIYENEDNFALQMNPYDWLDAGEEIINCFVGKNSWNSVSVGISFTSCTIVPVNARGLPLLDKLEFTKENAKNKPSYFPKLWKHHSAMSQKMADELNAGLKSKEW